MNRPGPDRGYESLLAANLNGWYKSKPPSQPLGPKTGNKASPLSIKRTSTSMPIETSSGAQPTMFVPNIGPSSSCNQGINIG